MIRVQNIYSVEIAINKVNEEENCSNYSKSFKIKIHLIDLHAIPPPLRIKQPQNNLTS